MNDHITRPADLASAPLRDLLDGYQSHVSALVNARHGIGEPEPVGRLRGDALDALACGQALADQILASRWVCVLDALTYAASVDDVAAAMGLDGSEVAAGLRSWADGQLRLRYSSGGQLGITPAQHAEVLDLVAGWSA